MKFNVPLAILSMLQPRTKQWFILLHFSQTLIVKKNKNCFKILFKYYLNPVSNISSA